MPNQINQNAVKQLKEKVAKAKSIVVTDYSGLKSNSINELRQTMKNNDAEVSVSKNTLLKIALQEEKVDLTALEKDLEGTNAVIFAYNDAVAPIKALFEFIKKVELPKVKSAIFEGKYTDAAQVEAISKLPSKEQLIAQVVGGFKSPLNGIVRTFSGVQQKFVYALAAVAAKKEGSK
jgi:large subunit ribosomal protein L10